MLAYEHDRTEDIVSRLVRISTSVRNVVLLSLAIIFGAIGTLVSALLLGQAWVGAIIGFIAGLLLGSPIASMVTILIEWMAQLLVAQGEILAVAKEREERL